MSFGVNFTQVPREILLEIAENVELSPQDLRSLRLTHRIFAEALAHKVLGSVQIPLPSLVGVFKKDGTVSDIQQQKDLKELIGSSKLSALLRNTYTLRITSLGNASGRVIPADYTFDSDDTLETTIRSFPSLGLLDIRIDIEKTGPAVVASFLNGLSRILRNPENRPSIRVEVTLDRLSDLEAEVCVLKHISGVALLRITGDVILAGDQIAWELSKVIERNTELEELSLLVGGKAPPLSVVLKHLPPEFEPKLRHLEIDYRTLCNRFGPSNGKLIEDRLVARLKNMEELRIVRPRTASTGTNPHSGVGKACQEIWLPLRDAGVKLRKVDTQGLNKDLWEYLSDPQLHGFLKILHLEDFRFNHCCAKEVARHIRAFQNAALPNAAPSLEELTLLPYSRETVDAIILANPRPPVGDISTTRCDETASPLTMLEMWSMHHWFHTAPILPSLKKLNTYITIHKTHDFISVLSNPQIFPKLQVMRLFGVCHMSFGASWFYEQSAGLHTQEAIDGLVQRINYNAPSETFTQGTDLIFDSITYAEFGLEKKFGVSRSEQWGYEFTGRKWRRNNHHMPGNAPKVPCRDVSSCTKLLSKEIRTISPPESSKGKNSTSHPLSTA